MNNITAKEFSEALEANEANMGEMAAMAVTCEQFGISEEEGFDLLVGLVSKLSDTRSDGVSDD